MDAENFDFIVDLVKKRTGLILNQDKKYLVESRLRPLGAKHSLGDHVDLVQYVRATSDEKLLSEIADAMTTNETFFFRDEKVFEIFREKIIPAIIKNKAKEKKLRIWCCASSTGQEPYTISMILNSMAINLLGWHVDIIATDISSEALYRAKSARFTQFEVQRGLPVKLLIKYFENRGEMWELKPALRDKVQFKNFNLLDDYGELGQFDVVFCRNVLIYFDIKTKIDVLNRISNSLFNDGVLFLGGSETVVNLTEKLKPMAGNPGAYICNDGLKKRVAL